MGTHHGPSVTWDSDADPGIPFTLQGVPKIPLTRIEDTKTVVRDLAAGVFGSAGEGL